MKRRDGGGLSQVLAHRVHEDHARETMLDGRPQSGPHPLLRRAE
jgi:hypothetical protein